MTREKMIDKLVEDDINDIERWIMQSDYEFLDRVLRGTGWTQYNNLTDEQVLTEYQDREFEEQV